MPLFTRPFNDAPLSVLTVNFCPDICLGFSHDLKPKSYEVETALDLKICLERLRDQGFDTELPWASRGSGCGDVAKGKEG